MAQRSYGSDHDKLVEDKSNSILRLTGRRRIFIGAAILLLPITFVACLQLYSAIPAPETELVDDETYYNIFDPESRHVEHSNWTDIQVRNLIFQGLQALRVLKRTELSHLNETSTRVSILEARQKRLVERRKLDLEELKKELEANLKVQESQASQLQSEISDAQTELVPTITADLQALQKDISTAQQTQSEDNRTATNELLNQHASFLAMTRHISAELHRLSMLIQDQHAATLNALRVVDRKLRAEIDHSEATNRDELAAHLNRTLAAHVEFDGAISKDTRVDVALHAESTAQATQVRAASAAAAADIRATALGSVRFRDEEEAAVRGYARLLSALRAETDGLYQRLERNLSEATDRAGWEARSLDGLLADLFARQNGVEGASAAAVAAALRDGNRSQAALQRAIEREQRTANRANETLSEGIAGLRGDVSAQGASLDAGLSGLSEQVAALLAERQAAADASHVALAGLNASQRQVAGRLWAAGEGLAAELATEAARERADIAAAREGIEGNGTALRVAVAATFDNASIAVDALAARGAAAREEHLAQVEGELAALTEQVRALDGADGRDAAALAAALVSVKAKQRVVDVGDNATLRQAEAAQARAVAEYGRALEALHSRFARDEAVLTRDRAAVAADRVRATAKLSAAARGALAAAREALAGQVAREAEAARAEAAARMAALATEEAALGRSAASGEAVVGGQLGAVRVRQEEAAARINGAVAGLQKTQAELNAHQAAFFAAANARLAGVREALEGAVAQLGQREEADQESGAQAWARSMDEATAGVAREEESVRAGTASGIGAALAVLLRELAAAENRTGRALGATGREVTGMAAALPGDFDERLAELRTQEVALSGVDAFARDTSADLNGLLGNVTAMAANEEAQARATEARDAAAAVAQIEAESRNLTADFGAEAARQRATIAAGVVAAFGRVDAGLANMSAGANTTAARLAAALAALATREAGEGRATASEAEIAAKGQATLTTNSTGQFEALAGRVALLRAELERLRIMTQEGKEGMEAEVGDALNAGLARIRGEVLALAAGLDEEINGTALEALDGFNARATALEQRAESELDVDAGRADEDREVQAERVGRQSRAIEALQAQQAGLQGAGGAGLSAVPSQVKALAAAADAETQTLRALQGADARALVARMNSYMGEWAANATASWATLQRNLRAQLADRSAAVVANTLAADSGDVVRAQAAIRAAHEANAAAEKNQAGLAARLAVLAAQEASDEAAAGGKLSSLRAQLADLAGRFSAEQAAEEGQLGDLDGQTGQRAGAYASRAAALQAGVAAQVETAVGAGKDLRIGVDDLDKQVADVEADVAGLKLAIPAGLTG